MNMYLHSYEERLVELNAAMGTLALAAADQDVRDIARNAIERDRMMMVKNLAAIEAEVQSRAQE